MEKMDQREWSQFNRTFWVFGMSALAAHKANYLLDEKNGFKFSKAKKQNIIREFNIAIMNQEMYFEELLKMGIPPYMISTHLQVDKGKK